MKNRFYSPWFLPRCLVLTAIPQDIIRQKPCTLESILHQADSIKTYLANQGFIVERSICIYGKWIWNAGYRTPYWRKLVSVCIHWRYEFQIIWSKDVWLEWAAGCLPEKMWGDVDGNVISYSYIPQFTEYHMMKPIQVNKTPVRLCDVAEESKIIT